MGKLSDFLSGLGEKAQNVADAIANPIEDVGGVVGRVLGNISDGVDKITKAATIKTEVKVDYMSVILPVVGLFILIKIIK